MRRRNLRGRGRRPAVWDTAALAFLETVEAQTLSFVDMARAFKYAKSGRVVLRVGEGGRGPSEDTVSRKFYEVQRACETLSRRAR